MQEKGGDQERKYGELVKFGQRRINAGAIAGKPSNHDQNPFGVAVGGRRDLNR